MIDWGQTNRRETGVCRDGMAIRGLEPDVIQKIAAGEVIERPASAVKELVENALDAQAHSVQVEVRAGGLGLIRVVDDGQGIAADDVALAFAPHATSKLSRVEDLAEIQTLGFRGEALASIAAVSQIVCHTHQSGDELGVAMTLEAGQIVERKPWAGPIGTSILVRNLFFNVPVRLKFLRSASSEAGQIGHLLEQFALGHPGVCVRFLNEDRRILETPGSGELRDAVRQVYGSAIAEAMIPIEATSETAQVQIRGLISRPDQTRATRTGLSFFVNRRRINNPSLSYAVEEAYQPELPAGRHPIVVLHLELPPSAVDCNVHPTKAEVRLANDRSVHSAVYKAVREALLEVAPLPSIGSLRMPAAWPTGDDRFEAAAVPLSPSAPSRFDPGPMPPVAPVAEGTPGATGVANASEAAPPGFLNEQPVDDASFDGPFRPTLLRAVGQVQNTYIVAEGPSGVFFIDQHTAHERVLYEEILAQRQRPDAASQALLTPVVVRLNAKQRGALTERGDSLRQLGFQFEEFGPDAFVLRAVPPAMTKANLETTLRDLADALTGESDAPDGSDRLIATMACHSAVRAGDSLSAEEIAVLLAKLEQTDVSRYCPHGRPVVIHLPTAQLERDFKRR